MKTPKKPYASLAEIEREVVAESREWGRQRLEERLQGLADQQGEVFPPQAAQTSEVQPAKRTGRHQSNG